MHEPGLLLGNCCVFGLIYVINDTPICIGLCVFVCEGNAYNINTLDRILGVWTENANSFFGNYDLVID